MTEPAPFTDESWWSRPSGVREVLRIALPMVASTLSWTLMNFTDGWILYRVSDEAMAASFTGGLAWFLAISLFWGTCSYTSTFVSQYFGDDQPERIGPAVWQGIWLAGFFAPLALALIPLGSYLFASHRPELAALESTYFQILCWASPGMLAAQALEGFFSGRGRTRVVMCVDAAAVAFNILLDCILVFGWLGMSSWGLEGAAWATVTAQWSRVAMYLAIMLRRAHRDHYNTLRGAGLDRKLLGRLLRFGGPNGVQMLLDIGGFTFFVMMVGTLPPVDSKATALVFRLSHLAFMPAWGFGIATTVLVGQRLGEGRPDLASRAARTTLTLALAYMGLISVLFVALPDLFLSLFTTEAGPDEPAVHAVATRLLAFVAAYNMFDATLIIMSSVLRGAGDMRFIMRVSMIGAMALIAATWAAVEWLDAGVYGCWTIITAWIWLLAVTYVLRYRQGAWQSMRVIDQVHHGGGRVLEENAPAAPDHPEFGGVNLAGAGD